MLDKWFKALKKRFSKRTAEEQNAVRKSGEDKIDEPEDETKQKSKTKLKRSSIMDDEKKVETAKVEEETKTDEVKQDKPDDKVEETEKKVETDKKEEEPTKEEQTAPEVEETEPVGNGIRIEDLVTKDELMERLSAFEAKFEAVIKENTDLKNQLSAAKEESNGLKEKYENKDFGNFSPRGVVKPDKDANETFESYSRQFM